MAKSSSTTPKSTKGLGVPLKSGNGNEYPLSYAESIWDIAAQSTNLARVMLEAGAAPSGSQTGEGQYGQNEINEALAESYINYRQHISDTLAAELKKEIVNITLTVSSSGTLSDLNGVVVTIKERETGVTLWTGTWQGQMLTATLNEGWRYVIEFSTMSKYGTPTPQRYDVVFGNTRQVTAEYLYLTDAVDVFYIDDSIDDPDHKITGTIAGVVERWIRSHSHIYLTKKIGEGQVAICQLDDSNSNYYFDGVTPAVLTGGQGDVMTRWAEFYYKVTHVSTAASGGKKWEIMLSLTNFTGDMQHWDGNWLLGTYEGYVNGTRLYSRSSSYNQDGSISQRIDSTGNVSQANFKTYARNRGAGYSIMQWIQHNVHALLFYSRYGKMNSQAVLGYGTDSYTKECGQTTAIGMQDTVGGGNGDRGSIKNYGIENSHGNKLEWIDNIIVDYYSTGNIWRITELDDTIRQVVTQAGTNAHVWPTRMVLGDHFDLIAAPDNIVGNDSKGYCDGFYLANFSSRVVYVSSYYASTYGGVACANALHAASSASASYGARLAFHGEITEYDDVNAFIALTDLT